MEKSDNCECFTDPQEATVEFSRKSVVVEGEQLLYYCRSKADPDDQSALLYNIYDYGNIYISLH